MRKIVPLLALLLTVAPAHAESFLTYFGNRPTAATPLGGSEKILLLQGGAVKQALAGFIGAAGGAQLTTTADHNIFVGAATDVGHYNIFSLNGSTVANNGEIGLAGGGTGDNGLYFETVTSAGGGTFKWVAGGVVVADYNSRHSTEWTFSSDGGSAYGLTHTTFYVAGDNSNVGPGFFVTFTGASGTAQANFALDLNKFPYLGFAGATAAAAPGDTILNRQAAGIFGMQNGTVSSPAALWIFRTSDALDNAPTLNYERATIDFSTNSPDATIGTQAGGSGTVRKLNFVAGTNIAFNLAVPNGANPEVIIDSSYGLVLGGANNVVAFSNTSNAVTANVDLQIGRDAAGTLQVGDQTLTHGGVRVYNVAGTNYERGTMDFTTNSPDLTIGAQAHGSGTLRNVGIVGNTINVTATSSTINLNANLTNSGGFAATQAIGTVSGFFACLTGDAHCRANIFVDGAGNGRVTFNPGTADDAGLARVAASVVEFNNGTLATGPGVILPRSSTFANLPASPIQGMMVSITDGLAANCGDAACTTFGTNVTGGTGALKLNLWYNGAHWTLVGK